MSDWEEFNWRLEEACANAWPAAASVLFDGWRLCFSGGAVRRANSVNPLRGPRGAPPAIIDFAEQVYGARGCNAIFRVPAIADDLDTELAARGYVEQARTLTLFCERALSAAGHDPAVQFLERPDTRWFDARARMAGAERRLHEAMPSLLLVPARFASIEIEGRIVAQAYAAIHRGVVVFNSVATDAAFRQRGYGRRVLSALLAWARGEGADTACLQVMADNAPALALYRSLGLRNVAYPYHYRVRP